jgi:hypothetical protein
MTETQDSFERMDLEQARQVAASLFATEQRESPEERKRHRRRVGDELRHFEELWDQLSPDAYLLLVQAAEQIGFDDLDIGAVANVARQTLAQKAGPKSYGAFHRAAVPLINWWERERGASPLTKYAGDNTNERAPSEPVKFLRDEFKRFAEGMGEQLRTDIAFRCWQSYKSNASSRSNSDLS